MSDIVKMIPIRIKILLALTLSLVCLVCLLNPAQAGEKFVSTTMSTFLKLPVGARPTALGGAFTGVADDANALSVNPAGLSQLNYRQVIINHHEWLLDSAYEYLGVVHPVPFGRLGTAGIGILYLNLGDFEGRYYRDAEAGIKAGQKAPDFKASNILVALSYSWQMRTDTLAGLRFGFLRERLEEETANGVTCDIGVLHRLNVIPGLIVGIEVKNMGPSIEFIGPKAKGPLPFTVQAGASYRALGDDLLLTMDIVEPIDNDVGIHLGAEYRLFDTFVRAGYRKSDLGPGITGGLGFELTKNYRLDYAYAPFDDLGRMHSLSLLAKF